MGNTVHCMLCGKKGYLAEPAPQQEFYLCGDCTRFWLADYWRRLKSGLVALLPRNWR